MQAAETITTINIITRITIIDIAVAIIVVVRLRTECLGLDSIHAHARTSAPISVKVGVHVCNFIGICFSIFNSMLAENFQQGYMIYRNADQATPKRDNTCVMVLVLVH